MYFEDLASFIAMDGHGFYVWSCYGIALIVVLYNIFAPLRQKHHVLSQVKRQLLTSKRASDQQNNKQSPGVASPGSIKFTAES